MEEIVIIGCGPAGLACSIYLAQNGKKSLILEKRSELVGKVCGDGLSVKCIKEFEKINISTLDLINAGGAEITRKYDIRDYGIQEIIYDYSCVGLSRDKMEKLLYDKTISLGSKVIFGYEVIDVKKFDNYYLINGEIRAKEVVLAHGITSKLNKVKVNDLPLGISARVYGTSDILKNDAFYFKYNQKYGNGYAWVFPIGKDFWNIGVWNSDKKENMKEIYQEFEKALFDEYINFISYDRSPGGALIGATLMPFTPTDKTIGDALLLASYTSGEGITYAISSGIEMAKKLI